MSEMWSVKVERNGVTTDYTAQGEDAPSALLDLVARLTPRKGSIVNPWRDLAHDLRTFAQHAPGCEYQPTYPETGDTTCSCGFDDVLDQYDRRSA